MANLTELRSSYHDKLGQQVIRFSKRAGTPYPNFADCGSRSSVLIANGIAEASNVPHRISRQIPA